MAESRAQTEIWNGIKKPPGRENAFKVVLSISPNDEDRASLKGILESDWTVVASSTVASALSLLREIPIPIVICDCDISSGTWREMLDHLSLLPYPPQLIVASRLADERLWAEALNLGAWDVLAKPFDADEVIRIVEIARQYWQDRHGACCSATKRRKSAGAERDVWLLPEHSLRRRNKMEAIFLTDDELKRLEARFGPVVRQMGPWNSDGTFGYASVPVVAVEKATEALANRDLLTALARLRTPEGTTTFIELLGDFGPALVERIVDAYREFSLWPGPPVSMYTRNTS